MSIAAPETVSHGQQTRVTHTFYVGNDAELCADVRKQYGKSSFAPRVIVVEVVDGTVQMTRASGPRRNAGDKLGVSISDDYYVWRSVPDPIKQFLAPRIPTAIPVVTS